MIFRLLLACWVSVLGIAMNPLPSRADVAGSLVIAGNGPENATIEMLARAFEKANPRVYIDILWEDNSKPVELVKSGQAHIAVTLLPTPFRPRGEGLWLANWRPMLRFLALTPTRP